MEAGTGRLDRDRDGYSLRCKNPFREVLMRKRLSLLLAVAFISLVLPGAGEACDTQCPLSHERTWDRLVEKSFALPNGLGSKLMTEEEWGERKKMMVRMPPLERQAYKETVRRELLKKAMENGITISQGKTINTKKSRERKVPFEYAATGTESLTE